MEFRIATGAFCAIVAGLARRLAAEGGPPADRARLIGAHTVADRRDTARRIYDQARTVFAGSPGALAIQTQAAAPLDAANEARE